MAGMSSDGQIVFEVTADGKKAIANIKDITDAIKTESKKWDQTVDASAQNMTSSMAKALDINRLKDWGLKAGKALLDFGKAAIEAASDLAEVQNVVDTTFGDNAAQIESWAQKAGAQFGLTETQAKKFTSTLGAMMKSAGMSGNEIVEMSTDLAGLAADMASFYNLDFETAFQKIRSGISGETEPLKQLGINMSVANLEAYALSQGITKAFNSMSQGEQTMLRYQYLMQATADAQGDFAKTADGYANASRRVEAAFERIKTSLGKVMMPAVEEATVGLASFLEKLAANDDKTVLDQFNEIDLNTAEKIAQVEETAGKARELVTILEGIQESTAGQNLQKIVNSLTNVKLDQRDSGIVTGFLEALNKNINELASVRGESAEEAKKWLEGIAQKANELDPNSVKGWGDLITEITNGIPGLSDTEAGATLLANLQQIAGTDAAGTITAITEESGKIDTTKTGKIASDLEGIAKSKAGENVKEIAKKIGEIDLSNGKAAALQELLSKLSADIWGLSAVTGGSAQGVADWLEAVAAAASGLTEEDVAGWTTIADMIKNGIPGLDQTAEGKSFLEALGLKEMTAEEQQAIASLEALGISTDGVADKQALWLETCKRLVSTIPGLSSIINTETGEIDGGTEAVKEYIKAWEDGQKKMIAMRALEKKEQALANKRVEVVEYELDFRRATIARKNFEEANKAFMDRLAASGGVNKQALAKGDWGKIGQDYYKFIEAEESAEDALKSQSEALAQAEEDIKLYRQAVDEMPGELNEAAGAVSDWSEETQTAAKKAVAGAQEALSALSDYVQGVHDSTAQAVDGVISGFGKVSKAGEELRTKSSELAGSEVETLTKYTSEFSKWLDGSGAVDLKRMSDNWDSLTKEEKEAYNALVKIKNEQKEVNDSLNQYRPEGMKAALQSQIDYMQEYLANLQQAREWGLSDELLASLSDGSEESAEYLAGLVAGGQEQAQEVDALYQEVQKVKEGFTDALTNQKLTVDETYQAMVESAKKAIDEMKLGDQAAEASGETVSGLATGISSHVSEVSAAVDSILSELNRLSSWGINIDLGAFGSFGFSFGNVEPLAKGMDFVPFDGYLASLHEGEGVLTAEENRIWQRFKNGTPNSGMDYDALGGVMRDNVKAGGDVYLDGRTVGQVISAQQGKSFRTLKRSGWQG